MTLSTTLLITLTVSILILAWTTDNYKIKVKWFKVTKLWTIIKQPEYTVVWIGHLAITLWKEDK